MKAIGTNDTGIESMPADRWRRSWEKRWTVLPPRPARAAGADGGSGRGRGMSKGAIAGVSVGAVLAGLSLLALAAFLLWRRRRRAAQQNAKLGAEGEGGWAGSPSGVFEKDTITGAASDSSAGTRSEVDGQSPIVEAGGRQRFEAPAAGTFMAELPGGNKALPELPSGGSHQHLTARGREEEGEEEGGRRSEGGNVSSESGSGSGSGNVSGNVSGSGSGSEDLRKKFWRR